MTLSCVFPEIARLAPLSLGLILSLSGCASFGENAGGARLERMKSSPNYREDRFVNPEPMYTNRWGGLRAVMKFNPDGIPHEPLEIKPVPKERFEKEPGSGLRVTWLGHSTLLIEIDGHRILTDPVWSKRVSPYQWIGPKRWYAPPLALASLPELNAVVISHDHYDHLDYQTIVDLGARKKLRFIVPLGVGAHLESWGISPSRIEEVDWWDEVEVGELKVACVPSRHASGRSLFDRDETLWAGYAILGDAHRVYFSGDTGMFPGFEEIGTRYGPFDLTMIEVGAYNRHWPDWHIGPEQALIAHRMVRGRFFLPIHWGLFQLGQHGWTEPIERVLQKGHEMGISVATPRPGQSLELSDIADTERWWPKLDFRTEDEDPIRSTKKGDKKKRLDLKKWEK